MAPSKTTSSKGKTLAKAVSSKKPVAKEAVHAKAASKPETKHVAKPAADPVAHKEAVHKEHSHKEVSHKEVSHKKAAGAHATGSGVFVVNRRWSGKPVQSAVGGQIRVELPENAWQGMSWQLQKLPHGVNLEHAVVEQVERDSTASTHQLTTQQRVFNFSLQEAGEYVLQFNLNRPFGQQGYADTFRVKVQASEAGAAN